jgi:hypothetical protein
MSNENIFKNKKIEEKDSPLSVLWETGVGAFNATGKQLNWTLKKFHTPKTMNFAKKNLGEISGKWSSLIGGGIKFKETGDWKAGATATGTGYLADKAFSTRFTAKMFGKLGHLKAGGASTTAAILYGEASYNMLYDIPKHRVDPTWQPTGFLADHPLMKTENLLVKNDKKAYLNYLNLKKKSEYTKIQTQNAAYTKTFSKYGDRILSKTKQFGSYAKNAAIVGGKGMKFAGGKVLSFLSKFLKFHSGGTVPGRGEIMAMLKGGETVRTEEQERALQEELLRRRLQSSDNQKEQKQVNRNSLQPRLSKDDDKYILGLIIDAFKRNRYGFRTLLRS